MPLLVARDRLYRARASSPIRERSRVCVLTEVTPNNLTDDFVELATPTAPIAVSGASRVAFIIDGLSSRGAGNVAIVEFWVDDADAPGATCRS